MGFQKKKVLLMVETSTSYGRDLLTGITRYALERNEWTYTILPRGITELPDYIRHWKGDGVIARSPDLQFVRFVESFGCPVVEMMYWDQPDIYCDERAMARLALDHFEEHYAENVGYFSYGGVGWIRYRCQQFTEECRERGFSPFIFESKVLRRDRSPDPVWKQEYDEPLRAWLRDIPKPIFLLAANDHQAVNLINRCRTLGYRMPEDIAVLGYNNDVHLCNMLVPSLSSIDQNTSKIGYEAARLLDKKMRGEDCTGYKLCLPPLKVVSRDSTNRFTSSDPDVSRALHFIREFATSGISVSDILAEVPLTARTLERKFRDVLGHSPGREILLAKLRHSIGMLINSELSSRRVAELSGFSNEQYFCKVFKREMGITPKEYRSQRRLSDPAK